MASHAHILAYLKKSSVLAMCAQWALFSWCILTYIVYFSNLHSIREDLWWSVGCVVGQSNPSTSSRRFTADRVVNYLLQWRSKITRGDHKFSAQQFKGQPSVHYSPVQERTCMFKSPTTSISRLYCFVMPYFMHWQSWVNGGLVSWKIASKHDSGFLHCCY